MNNTDTVMTPTKAPFHVFISSPGGLDTEKEIANSEINTLSQESEQEGEPLLTVTAWPHGIAAGNAYYGQSVINRQLVDIDILLCIIGSRFGTRTPRANSGTEEEFDRAIQANLQGGNVQILLFFSNRPTRIHDIDPQQLFLIKAFQAKASRLGVLYQYYGDHDEFRHLVRMSIRSAYDALRKNIQPRHPSPAPDSQPESIALEIPELILKDGLGPQRASEFIIPLAPYRAQEISITGALKTSSPYFRFGFKYFDAREPVYSAGSIQTPGQNFVFHVAKNVERPEWFWTSYRASSWAHENTTIPNTAGIAAASFTITITPEELITFHLNDEQLFAIRFPVDGIPNIALLAWGDEHRFQCDITNLRLITRSR